MHRAGGRWGAGAAALAIMIGMAACGDDGDAADAGSDEDATQDGQGDDDAGASDGSGEISVLSYNVAGLPQEISSENPEEHIPLISPLLNEYDIVLTQEDFDWWTDSLDGLDFVNYHDRLRAETTHEHQTAQHPGPDAVGVTTDDRPELSVGDGLGVLSRFPFTNETRVPWEGCFGSLDTSDGGAADCPSMKGFAMVRMTLADGVEVDVYTLHAEAGGTEQDQQLQEDDFEQLAAFIEANSEGRAIILGGDTNLHTESDHADASGDADTQIWADFLDTTGLTDACHAVDCPDRSEIDKFAFRSGDGVDLTALTHDLPRDTFKDPQGEDLSDHPPLVVTFAWEAA